jgi:hypothetical protein
MGDLFGPVLELKQQLPDLKKVAASAVEEAPISLAAQADERPKTVRGRTTGKAAAKRPGAGKTKRKL